MEHRTTCLPMAMLPGCPAVSSPAGGAVWRALPALQTRAGLGLDGRRHGSLPAATMIGPQASKAASHITKAGAGTSACCNRAPCPRPSTDKPHFLVVQCPVRRPSVCLILCSLQRLATAVHCALSYACPAQLLHPSSRHHMAPSCPIRCSLRCPAHPSPCLCTSGPPARTPLP